ncbi:MAG: porphobilinogen synthase [Pseudomonadota bacterium]|nr:porphobilinogen synthase [Pseudomonadota bacterium]
MPISRPFPAFRSRRMRRYEWSRALVCEHRLHPNDFILPIFVHDKTVSEPIKSMPGVVRHSLEDLLATCEMALRAEIPAIAIFPVIPEEKKDRNGTEALREDNILLQAIAIVRKQKWPLGIITDVALDPYTTHSHDGILKKDGTVDNDKTIHILAKQACLQAHAGADIIAPSDMQDGRIGVIRKALDTKEHTEVGILSYTAKYASVFYGPFRDAIGAHGLQSNTNVYAKDKKHYQLAPSNRDEAIHVANQSLQEGADCLMVKPGMPYLDIIQTLKEKCQAPVFAYQVSGEYSMLKSLAQTMGKDDDEIFLEASLCLKRAGAQNILSYHAIQLARALQAGKDPCNYR